MERHARPFLAGTKIFKYPQWHERKSTYTRSTVSSLKMSVTYLFIERAYTAASMVTRLRAHFLYTFIRHTSFASTRRHVRRAKLHTRACVDLSAQKIGHNLVEKLYRVDAKACGEQAFCAVVISQTVTPESTRVYIYIYIYLLYDYGVHIVSLFHSLFHLKVT